MPERMPGASVEFHPLTAAHVRGGQVLRGRSVSQKNTTSRKSEGNWNRGLQQALGPASLMATSKIFCLMRTQRRSMVSYHASALNEANKKTDQRKDEKLAMPNEGVANVISPDNL